MILPINKKILDFDSLKAVYAEYNLPAPAIIQWPLSEQAEAARITRETRFRQYLSNKLPSGLSWMQKHADTKYRPDNIMPGCRTIFLSHLGYYRQDIEDNDSCAVRKNKGRIARYARGRDYHKELGNRLKKISKVLKTIFPKEQFVSFTDIGPLDEVWLAEVSGAGFRGRNGLAILRETGSWAVLGHLLTSAAIAGYTVRPSLLACPDGCRRCIEACPSNALKLPGILDPAKCISYQSIEHKGIVDKNLRKNSMNWIFGCDVCQEVCPFNYKTEETDVEEFRHDRAGASLDLTELLSIKTREEFVERYAGSPIMRPGLTGMMRNACTAAGNTENPDLIPLLIPLAENKDVGIREHAKWAIGRITKKHSPKFNIRVPLTEKRQ